MQVILRWLLSYTLKPFLQHYYLKSSRKYRYKHRGKPLTLTVEPGVFHPGLFFSTKFMAGFISDLTLTNSQVLDMGCGSGLLSLVAAQQGANVLSADLSDAALQCTKINGQRNDLNLTTIKSDLFKQISGRFDYIVVNPPYYPKEAQNQQQLAWYCGEQFDYFQRFFAALNHHINHNSQVFMVLSQGCDLPAISAIAKQHQFTMRCVCEKQFWLETNYIYAIEHQPTKEQACE